MTAGREPVVLAYITAPDVDTARKLARALVEERLAACVNIGAPIESVYRWEGRVETSAEIPLLVKTRRGRLAGLIERVRALHPYQVPCVVAWEVADGHPPFLRWVTEETA